MTAVLVAVMTAALTALPWCWAAEMQLVAIPQLPSMQLAIPSMNAQVTVATNKPAPGYDVGVWLNLTSPARTDETQVPVTVTLQKTTYSPSMRSVPPPKVISQIETSVPVKEDGHGLMLVKLPIKWSAQALTYAANSRNTAYTSQLVSTYQLVLSSSLAGSSAPATMQTVAIDNSQTTATASTTPAPQPNMQPPAYTAAGAATECAASGLRCCAAPNAQAQVYNAAAPRPMVQGSTITRFQPQPMPNITRAVYTTYRPRANSRPGAPAATCRR